MILVCQISLKMTECFQHTTATHPLSPQNVPKTFPGLPVNQNYLTRTPDLSLGVLACKTPHKKDQTKLSGRREPQNIVKTPTLKIEALCSLQP